MSAPASDITGAPWLRRLIVAALLAGLVLLAFQVLASFIVPVVWAVIIAYTSWPANSWLRSRLGGRASLAALLLALLITAAVMVPLVWLVLTLQTEMIGAYQDLATAIGAGKLQLPEAVLRLPVAGDWLRDTTERIARNPAALSTELKQLVDLSSGEIARFIGGVGRNLVKLGIAMLSLFFVYRDGEHLAVQVRRVLELILGARVHEYLQAIGATVKAVVYGLVLAALAQGLLAGVGYWVTGIPAPAFLAAVTTLSAMIPFAVPFVWGAASLWLLLTGKTVAAVGLFVWGAIAVSWIDNVVRPMVISSATRIPFLLVLFGVLGGLEAFGLVGLFVGPVILAVLIAVWREWLLETTESG